MENKYIKNCSTREFGLDNNYYDEMYKPVNPLVLEISHNGSNEHWRKVEHDFCCECWGARLRDFSRVRRRDYYEEFYKYIIELLPKK